MKWKFGALIVLVNLLIVSCGIRENDEPQPDYTDAIQLNKGNYWVYESSTVDLASGLKNVQPEDSTFINKDTIVSSKVYYVVENMYGLREIKTQIADNIVDINNVIEFSGTNFTDTLYKDPSLNVCGLMQQSIEEIRVPAGAFKTACFLVLRKNSQGHHGSSDPNNPSVYNKDYSVARKVWYARGIGVVRSVTYFANSVGFERNLKRYKVNH
jgi:hypothetical protein